MLVFVLAVGIALVVSFLCSICESVLLSVRPAEVEEIKKEGRRGGNVLERFRRDMHVPIAAILILNTVAHTYGSSQGGVSFEELFPTTPLWVFQVVFTLAVLLFTEIVPKTLGVTFHKALAPPVAILVDGVAWVLRPMIAVTGWISAAIGSRQSHDQEVSAEEIRLMAELGRAQGGVGAKTANIISGAVNLRVFKADDVMVPRNRVVYLSGEKSVDENLRTIRQSGFSRFPFCDGPDLDSVRGVVLAKDLLFFLGDHPEARDRVDWDSLLRSPPVVPETMTLQHLLRTIQDARHHMAVVVDEYGGTAGIVTLEDILEELVGEIDDESDRPRRTIQLAGDGRWRCRGQTELRQVETLLGIRFDAESSTVSGLLAERLGQIPSVGQRIVEHGFEFAVTQATDRLAEWVEITRQPTEDE